MNEQPLLDEGLPLIHADAVALLASIESAAIDSLIVVDSRDERVLWSSRGAARLLCGFEQALAGKSVSSLLPMQHEAQQLSRLVAGVASVGRAVGEFTGRSEDGGLQPLFFSLGAANVNGLPLVHIVVRNLSQQRAIEHALRRDRERLLQAQRIARLGFWINDVTTGQLSWSDQIFDIFGVSRADFDGTVDTFYACVHPDDLEKVKQAVGRAVSGAERYDIEHRIIRPDGREVVVHERGEAMFDDVGRAIQLIGTVQDITAQKDIENELRSSRERLLDAQRIAKVGNFFWDGTTDSFEWSEELYRIYGLDPGAALPDRDTFYRIVHPDDRDLLRERVKSAIACTDRRFEHEFRAYTPAGEGRTLRVTAEIRRDDSGLPLRVLGTVQDVTERAAYERSLQQLSRAVEQSADHVLITDREGRIEYVNPSFTEQTGFTLDELKGLTPRVLRSDVHPSSFYERLWQTVIAGEVFRGVMVNKRKNGELFYEEKTITPIRNASGEITHFVSNARDITERIAAEKEQARLQAEIAKAAEAWRRTFDAIEFPVIVVDRTGIVRRANVAALELSRSSFGELIGKKLRDVADGTEPFSSAAVAASQVFGERRVSVRVTSTDRRNHWEVVATHFSELEDPQSFAIVSINDITGTVELQESLRRSEVMSVLGSIVAGVAHEVRNPLFSISATLDAFDARFGSQTDFQRYLTRLRGEVDRMSLLMKELLEYGKPPELQLARNKVSAAINQALAGVEPIAAKADVRIQTRCSAAGAVVLMDAGRIAQVFTNLLENAIHFTDPGKTVTIGCERVVHDGAPAIECYVSDQGKGFDPAELDSIFLPFYTRRRGGTGLGLSIVHRIIEQHGGSIRAANREEGGAIVSFTLKLAENEDRT